MAYQAGLIRGEDLELLHKLQGDVEEIKSNIEKLTYDIDKLTDSVNDISGNYANADSVEEIKSNIADLQSQIDDLNEKEEVTTDQVIEEIPLADY